MKSRKNLGVTELASRLAAIEQCVSGTTQSDLIGITLARLSPGQTSRGTPALEVM